MPAAADTRNDPGFRHARGPPCMNTRAWSRVDPGYLQLGQHLHSGPDVHDLERPRWLGGWVGGRGLGALRAQGQPGPSSGEPLCTRVSGPALLAQHEWGPSGPSEAHFQGRPGAMAQSVVPPHLGRRGSVFPQREVEKFKCRRARQPTQGPRAPEKEAGLLHLSALLAHTLRLKGQRERGPESERSSRGDAGGWREGSASGLSSGSVPSPIPGPC